MDKTVARHSSERLSARYEACLGTERIHSRAGMVRICWDQDISLMKYVPIAADTGQTVLW